MMRNQVSIVSAPRAVPALKVGGIYNIVWRSGAEFIVDGYGGYVPLNKVSELGIVING